MYVPVCMPVELYLDLYVYKKGSTEWIYFELYGFAMRFPNWVDAFQALKPTPHPSFS